MSEQEAVAAQVSPMYPQYGQGMGYGGYQPGMNGMNGNQMQMGQAGQPGQPMQPQDLRPQLNFRTVVRCFMELAAIIQGFSLILMMGNGWLQEMGSNEEQPLRRFAVWLASSLRAAMASLLPLGIFRRRPSLEDLWAEPPARSPVRWWVVLGVAYLTASFLQEWNAYRRNKKTPRSASASPSRNFIRT